MRDLSGFQTGQRAIFTEDGEILLVEVLAPEHDETTWGLRLKTLRILQRGPMTNGVTEFSISVAKEYVSACFGGMWHLKTLEEAHFPDESLPCIPVSR